MTGFVHARCPACDQQIRLDRHSRLGDLLDDVDYDRAYAALRVHLRHGCRVAADDADRAARRFEAPG